MEAFKRGWKRAGAEDIRGLIWSFPFAMLYAAVKEHHEGLLRGNLSSAVVSLPIFYLLGMAAGWYLARASKPNEARELPGGGMGPYPPLTTVTDGIPPPSCLGNRQCVAVPAGVRAWRKASGRGDG